MIASTTTPSKTHASAPQTSPISIAVKAIHDGRIPVIVSITPLEDLEVSGVFVEFRMGAMDQDDMPGGEPRSTSLAKGAEAIAALAKAESRQDDDGGPVKKKPMEPMATSQGAHADSEKRIARPDEMSAQKGMKGEGDSAKGGAPRVKRPLITHQIAQAQTLIVGQSETYRAEVTAPGDATQGAGWYIRGRFSAGSGKDLRSEWVRI